MQILLALAFNPGRVMRIAGTPAKIVWAEMDGPEGGEWDEP